MSLNPPAHRQFLLLLSSPASRTPQPRSPILLTPFLFPNLPGGWPRAQSFFEISIPTLGTLAISKFLSLDQISPLNSRLIPLNTPPLYLDFKQALQTYTWQQSLMFSSPTCSSPHPFHLTWWQLYPSKGFQGQNLQVFFDSFLSYLTFNPARNDWLTSTFTRNPVSLPGLHCSKPPFSHLDCYRSLPSYPLACSPKVYFYHSSHDNPFKSLVIPQLNEHAFRTFHLTQAQTPDTYNGLQAHSN